MPFVLGGLIDQNQSSAATSVPVTQAFGDAAAIGTSITYARQDHKHGMMASPALEKLAVTVFETAGRFATTAVASGVATFGIHGLKLDTSAIISSSISVQLELSIGTGIMAASPVVSVTVNFNVIGTDFQSFHGLGLPTVSGAGITYTPRHAGFKTIRAASGAVNLSATQADGTTENASAVLANPGPGDEYDVLIRVNGSASVDYYTRANDGVLSAATNLTSNLSLTNVGVLGLAVSNAGVATQTILYSESMSYRR